MRLFLTCLGVDGHDDLLVSVTGRGATIGVVLNAIDDRPSDRALAGEIEHAEMTRLGLRPVELDLREHADVARLATVDALWVRGGNTFALRYAMAAHGADAVIARRIGDDSLGYAGYSAGAAVLSPDLSAVAEVDDPSVVASPITTGLGVLDRPLIPHIGGSYDDGIACTALSRRLTLDGVAHHALRDGEALVGLGGELRLVPRR
ncbi:Type 1 glutamine amidotransferase-like domain-containing protein [Williamsia herbipolensis]|uniref:Type 1 glutamine amidotransferase-like domain-containing protein n=1 Tax=Williamsia herbipolensis TaxID=1603258 RepID=UPI000697023D|nr:Type 1 glutamine amidotransferase-like domain-containing protein [Williamsia herbipolensis]